MVDRGVIARDLSAMAVMLAAAFSAGLLSTGRTKPLGLAVSVIALVPPWFADPGFVRGALGLAGAVVVMRAIDLFRDPTPYPARRRLGHAVSPVDTRHLGPAAPRFDGRAFAAGLGWLVPGLAGLWIAFSVGPPMQVQDWTLRWLAGMVSAYGLVEALWATVPGIYALLGFSTPPLHRLPLVSRTIRELWGERWSRAISDWLDDTLYRPLVNRGWKRTGLAAAFLGSATLHAYAVWMGAGAVMALWMLAYFLVQAGVVLAERALGVQAWPRVAAHAWVVTVMVLTSPLFVEPYLRCVGLPG